MRFWLVPYLNGIDLIKMHLLPIYFTYPQREKKYI